MHGKNMVHFECCAKEMEFFHSNLKRERPALNIPGDTCKVCKITHAKDPNICFHRFPANAAQRDKRLSMFKLDESEAKPYFALHCRCFPGRNSTRPTSEFKDVFSSPKGIPRDKRVRAREASLLRKPISKPRQGADQLHQLLFCPPHPWPLHVCHLLHLLAKLCTSLHLFKSCWIATAAPYLQCTPVEINHGVFIELLALIHRQRIHHFSAGTLCPSKVLLNAAAGMSRSSSSTLGNSA